MLIGNQNYIASSTALLACILEVMNLLEKVDQQIKLRRIQTETLSSAQQQTTLVGIPCILIYMKPNLLMSIDL